VKGAKTNFLKITDIELNYKIKIVNQTPKIINVTSVVWERSEPFTDVPSTVLKETKISKPIIPYEERIIEYIEKDTFRNGETYRVKIVKVIFEDGTQWKNNRE